MSPRSRVSLAALLTAASLLPGPSPELGAQEGGCAPEGPPRTLTVRPGGPYAGLSAALADARAGDTVRMAAGTWEERATVACPVVLLGEEGAVLDGGGEGTVLSVRAPGTVIRGLTIRGSGRTVSTEDAGILAEASAGLRVEENTLEDVLFGVYLKESPDAVIRANRITGHDLPVADRGDAIRLWYSARGTIEGNVVRRSRDVVIWFSDSVAVRGNDIVGGRYGLHYMYSDHNRFERNRFRDNLVGAFLMYSSEITFQANVFSRSAGASGMGLGLKDADEIRARGNLFAGNAVGIYLDNSPRSAGAVNLFSGNRIQGNDVGVRIFASVRHNRFRGNDFVENAREVEVPGGGSARGNDWDGNHWSRYAGFDADHDGVGDTPWELARLSDHLLAVHPRLSLFAMSPAAEALDLLARVLPFLEPTPVVVDSLPRVEPAARSAAMAAEAGPATAPSRPGPEDGPGGFWVPVLALLFGLSAGAVFRHRRLVMGAP